MSASPTFMQSLLSSLAPWMTGGSSSALDNSTAQYGGTQGLLDAMMQAGNPNSSAAQFGKALEGSQNSALQRAAARQQLASQGLNLNFAAARQPLMLAAMRQRMQQFGLGAQPNASSAAPTGSAGAGMPATGAAPGASQGAPAQPGPSGATTQGGPMGLLNASVEDSILGMPWAGNELKAAQTGLQYDPGTATAMAAAKNQVSQDLQQLYQAYASGNPQLVQGMQTKLKTDMGQLHIGSMSGIMTAQQPNGSWSTINPSTGLLTNTATGTTLLPGAAKAHEAMAGANARGEAQGDVERVTDGNGNEYYVPRSVLLGGGAGSGAGNGSPSANTPFQATLGPAQEKLLESKGTQAATVNEEFQSKAEAGQQMLAQIAELRSAASDFSPGQFADSRIKMLQWLQSSNLISADQAKELGSAQAGQKIAIQLQAAATKQLGSREAAQIFQVMGKSLPNLTLSPDGLGKVSGYMSGIARYDIARAQVAQHRLAQNDVNGLNATRDDFIKNTNPTYFIIASMPPAQRAEMIQAMGPRAKPFLQAWNNAANAGWAPRPGAYDGS